MGLSADHTVMLTKRLYYAGICSYALCIILCLKVCWHSLPRPSEGGEGEGSERVKEDKVGREGGRGREGKGEGGGKTQLLTSLRIIMIIISPE